MRRRFGIDICGALSHSTSLHDTFLRETVGMEESSSFFFFFLWVIAVIDYHVIACCGMHFFSSPHSEIGSIELPSDVQRQ